MQPKQKHWRSKRVKSTLLDRIGKEGAQIWYRINLTCARRELEELVDRKVATRLELYSGGWDALAFIDRYEQVFVSLNRGIAKRHCKIERLKRFLSNLK